jgi:hypothetical protein
MSTPSVEVKCPPRLRTMLQFWSRQNNIYECVSYRAKKNNKKSTVRSEDCLNVSPLLIQLKVHKHEIILNFF